MVYLQTQVACCSCLSCRQTLLCQSKHTRLISSVGSLRLSRWRFTTATFVSVDIEFRHASHGLLSFDGLGEQLELRLHLPRVCAVREEPPEVPKAELVQRVARQVGDPKVVRAETRLVLRSRAQHRAAPHVGLVRGEHGLRARVEHGDSARRALDSQARLQVQLRLDRGRRRVPLFQVPHALPAHQIDGAHPQLRPPGTASPLAAAPLAAEVGKSVVPAKRSVPLLLSGRAVSRSSAVGWEKQGGAALLPVEQLPPHPRRLQACLHRSARVRGHNSHGHPF
mmetsp:Transcript_14343/g.29403  ORF Transcript_14343/g.29403 Transcript_14343/m.29403 type:complete len:281 (+) Transcript_14343:83-925(+)